MADDVITVENLRVRYGEKVAVDGVSFTVAEGEIFGILGPNGAGKTTTVECIGGLRIPDGGTITVHGLDPRRDRRALAELVGIQLQHAELPDKLRVGEAIALFASFYRTPADPEALLAQLGLEDRRETPFAKLSGGQKQRLSIALALIGNPRIAILDELTTGLDPQARRDTWGLIEGVRERGVTIILVTHFMEEAERLCDRVALINRGRVVATDSPSGMAGRVHGELHFHFQPSAPIDAVGLERFEEVSAVHVRGSDVEVVGHGNLLGVVVGELNALGVVAQRPRIDQANLEDAFVELTREDALNTPMVAEAVAR
ncbi:ABC transporter ATP-binding protein [Conexibacter sp. DBS9H8]|uniref:ABC transporter ATP-binding protein n=1 Tax=Conexibacter sp. DBS9H8 TaxID=2937801 RepID=UPI00200C63E3|nr:ABC transporter ATP-binding protein [Conexibacter sp. DBS9H8]